MTKRNTARSAKLHVLVYALLHREAPYQVDGSLSKTHSVVVGGGETQQELIPFKHKEWSVVYRPGIVGVDGDRDGCMARQDARGSSA